METTKFSVREMALIAVMTAVMCILGPMSVPIGVIPISLTNLVIYIAVYILGCRRGTISFLVYLLIGTAGVPVFSAYSGGVAKLLGPTGGYLIGFIFVALITGFFVDRFDGKVIPSFAGMLLSTILLYGFGTAWLAYQAGMTYPAALAAGVIPFIVPDIIKMIIAVVIGPQIRRRLQHAGLL